MILDLGQVSKQTRFGHHAGQAFDAQGIGTCSPSLSCQARRSPNGMNRSSPEPDREEVERTPTATLQFGQPSWNDEPRLSLGRRAVPLGGHSRNTFLGHRGLGSRRTGGSHPAKETVTILVRRLAPQYGLRPDLVLAVIEVESNYDPNARSAKNALGLMQLIPETASRFGVVDIWNPEENLRAGMAYLRWLLDHFDGDMRLALAGYNAGERAVWRHGGVPPYPETRAYVERIIRRLRP